MGAIQDRTQEHLGRSDVAIIRFRRMLRAAIANLEAGHTDKLPMRGAQDSQNLKGPLSNDAIADSATWQSASHEADLARRAACPWDASV
jgi:hypothetical protein